MSENIRKKIIEHLEGLNELERQAGPERLMEVLSERYSVPVEMIQKIIADWQASNY